MSVGSSTGNGTHVWRFFRAGGFDQVRLDTAQDLLALAELDQKLWLALSCPTRGLEFDSKTLDLMDTDKDARIRVPEVLAAVKWACAQLKDPADLLKGAAALPLAAIKDDTDEGRELLASARQLLANLGKATADSVSIDDTTDTERIFAQTHFNGDGIIPAESADDPAVRGVIGDIISCLGAKTDRSGRAGIDQAQTDEFFAQADAYSAWWAQAADNADRILPLGENTAAAAVILRQVRGKIDDYFARCRLAAFDPRAQAALNRQESEYLAIAARDLSITSEEIAGLPLARIEADKALPLKNQLNPAWCERIARFQKDIVTPLLGDKDELTEADWSTLAGRFAGFEGWNEGKVGQSVEKLGLPRVREILASNGRQVIGELIARDKALEPEANAIAKVDRLVRYHRDLCKLLNNFVTFRDFYGRRDKAIFQAGTLYLDQRSCDLCVRVDDMSRHATMAHLSRTYLAYCEVTRKCTGEKMTIAAAFSAGDGDNLMAGRNGIFYDRSGRDWDATILRIVDNPISIRQAFWAPYKRAIRWIEDQIAKRAAAADIAPDKLVEATAGAPAKAGQAPKPGPAKLDIGVVAALGVAVGGITAAMGALLQAFFGLGMWMPLGVVAMVFLISGPSMLIAWLKLRQRNLGPILDANGWAVNAKAKINIAFGRSLTAIARLPKGAKRDLRDPYAERGWGFWHWTAVIIIIAAVIWCGWYFGGIEKIIPGKLPKSQWYQQRHGVPAMRP